MMVTLFFSATLTTCSGVQLSRFTDFTRLMCTPRFRCMPAQRMQRNTPKFQDAQRGPFASQSTQYLLSSSRSIFVSSIWHFSCICFCRSVSFFLLIFSSGPVPGCRNLTFSFFHCQTILSLSVACARWLLDDGRGSG
uniref:Putative secreted protein n=1 Tax=Anopheles darlingi TaxID=43151 RepID=A0A2M4D6T9_ANODA